MTLRLTPNQYKSLMKMAWLANYVAKASEIQDSETAKEIVAMAQIVIAKAPEFGAEEMLSDELRGLAPVRQIESEPGETIMPGLYRPEIEEDLANILEWFEEFSFWELLEDRLSMRDISEERSEAQWNWLPDTEKDRLYYQHMNFYFEEFSENGLANLHITPSDPEKAKKSASWQGDDEMKTSPKERQAPVKDKGPTIIQFPGKPTRKQSTED